MLLLLDTSYKSGSSLLFLHFWFLKCTCLLKQNHCGQISCWLTELRQMLLRSQETGMTISLQMDNG